MRLNEYLLNSSWLLLVVMVMTIITGSFVWLFSLVMLGFSVFLRFNQKNEQLIKLKVERKVSGTRFQEASKIDVDLFITNISDVEFLGEIADELPNASSLIQGSNITLGRILPKQVFHNRYSFSFIRRGKYQVGPVHIRYHTQGEIEEFIWEDQSSDTVVVVPNPESVSSYSIPPSFFKSVGGPFKSKLIGEGINFTGIREYVNGDPLKRINWRQTAKRGVLHTNEFELNRPTDFIIIVDLTEESLFVADASVRAALGLIDYLTHWRCKVGLITIGEFVHFIPPKSGKRHILEISEHLTEVKSISKISNFELFTRRLEQTINKASSLKNEVLLFSSLNRIENALLFARILPQLGNMTVLSPSGSALPVHSNKTMSFAKTLVDNRRNILSHYLLKKNIKVFEWVPELPFELSVTKWRMGR